MIKILKQVTFLLFCYWKLCSAWNYLSEPHSCPILDGKNTGFFSPHGCVWQTQSPGVQHTAQGY